MNWARFTKCVYSEPVARGKTGIDAGEEFAGGQCVRLLTGSSISVCALLSTVQAALLLL
jgi:hypothetical protein